ncbi:MAG: GAF domain-containing protein [Acidobacteria bacterium]|nr:GAF domain-containing protein [Acidobacteriota bacterium]
MATTEEAWKHFLESALQNPTHEKIRPIILDSWRRSRSAGVDPLKTHILLRQVSLAELDRRLQINQVLVEISVPLIDEFSVCYENLKHVVYLVDADGIILYAIGTDFIMQAFGLSPGYNWSERVMGTNGAGTALASRRPVAVMGPEHYQLPFHDATCMGTPVFGGEDALLGAIDFTTHVRDADPAQLSAVLDLRCQIESRLKASLSLA